jgi:hypothetical protein
MVCVQYYLILDCRASDYKMFGGWWIVKYLKECGHGITEVLLLLSTLLAVLSKTTEVLCSDRMYHGWDSKLAALSAYQMLLLGSTVSVWELSLTVLYCVSLLLIFMSVLACHHHHHHLCHCPFECLTVINFVVRL